MTRTLTVVPTLPVSRGPTARTWSPRMRSSSTGPTTARTVRLATRRTKEPVVVSRGGLFPRNCVSDDPVYVDDTSLGQLYKSRTLQMATKILSDPTHFLHDLLPSGRRFRMPTVKTQRALKSFIPSSIKYLNQLHIK